MGWNGIKLFGRFGLCAVILLVGAFVYQINNPFGVLILILGLALSIGVVIHDMYLKEQIHAIKARSGYYDR